MSERTDILKAAVKILKGKMPIIVGTGTIDPQKVIELSQHALDMGADASLIITPYYGIFIFNIVIIDRVSFAVLVFLAFCCLFMRSK
jgi:hypothetical protein